ncbi:protein LYK2-like isoform X2 [Euphorbia lathyris]|uniref:protein LYK2-like isoform X2 n=1 Tax=Euphorbia lathyris TaxID=212925 RepID=UPI00331394BF
MPQKEEVAGSSSLSGRCDRILAVFGLTEEELEKCVNGFSEENFIGKFQFGDVYRGTYDGDDVIVKVWTKHDRYKVLAGENEGRVLAGENEGRLKDEMVLHHYFSRYEFHPNAAKLQAFCRRDRYLAAIYLPNPMAIDTLHNLIEKDTFTWEQRIKVAFGFASLLQYMHTPHPNCPSNFPYLICNIDAAHILVDQDHEPLLFDFSMISGGMLTDKRDLLNHCIQGCCAYSDPNFAQPGEWSEKCDVFSYGVLLLSLISKRIHKDDGDCTNVPFVYEWAKNEHKQQNSAGITNLAMLCVEYDPQKRPTMKRVVKHMKKLHIVRHNANGWECCKMPNGVNEVLKTRFRSKPRPGQLPFNHLKHRMRKTRGCHQTLSSGPESSDSMSCSDLNQEFDLRGFKSSFGVNNAIKVFSSDDLSTYTGGFSKENLIGEFQFGKVFRGVREGKKVIVKTWWGSNRKCYGGGACNAERLKDEISLLQHPRLLSHPNLVKMIGYCFEEEKLDAVYDLDPQDSLHNLAPKDEFTWLQRMKVIYEFAKLLEFLQAPNPTHVPYRLGNIDAEHIILDKEYSPKLIDFGATVGGIILSFRDSRNMCLWGCYGYIDSCFDSGAYEARDIFAYGIILLCLISKRIPREDESDEIFLAGKWAWDEYDKWVDEEEGSGFSLVHEDLREEVGFDPNDGVALTKLGLECVDCDDSNRPSMEKVVKRLRNLHVIRSHAEEMGIQK